MRTMVLPKPCLLDTIVRLVRLLQIVQSRYKGNRNREETPKNTPERMRKDRLNRLVVDRLHGQGFYLRLKRRSICHVSGDKAPSR